MREPTDGDLRAVQVCSPRAVEIEHMPCVIVVGCQPEQRVPPADDGPAAVGKRDVGLGGSPYQRRGATAKPKLIALPAARPLEMMKADRLHTRNAHEWSTRGHRAAVLLSLRVRSRQTAASRGRPRASYRRTRRRAMAMGLGAVAPCTRTTPAYPSVSKRSASA